MITNIDIANTSRDVNFKRFMIKALYTLNITIQIIRITSVSCKGKMIRILLEYKPAQSIYCNVDTLNACSRGQASLADAAFKLLTQMAGNRSFSR